MQAYNRWVGFFTSYDEDYDSFDSTGLHENLLKGIYAYGIVCFLKYLNALFPINHNYKRNLCRFQGTFCDSTEKIVMFCKVLDVIQQKQSGTRKTTTFCFGILQLDHRAIEWQDLVFATNM